MDIVDVLKDLAYAAKSTAATGIISSIIYDVIDFHQNRTRENFEKVLDDVCTLKKIVEGMNSRERPVIENALRSLIAYLYSLVS